VTAGKWQYKKPEPTPGKECKDCRAEPAFGGPQITRLRPAPHPGPRCHTHHNAEKRRRRLASKQRHVTRNFELSPEEYDELYEYQGGRCALCRRAKGTGSKRLAVDHDHHQAMLDGHHPDKGCRNCVRGLVCSDCNDVLAHARSMASFFDLGAAYLRQWPWKMMLAQKTSESV
jgi:hypothetical protein